MKCFQNILVATDTRLEEHPIVEEAAEVAVHNGASLKIVDVVPDFPWTVRLTMKDHQHMAELMRDEKQAKLDALAAQIRERGVNVETRVLHGKTSVAVIREVMRAAHDLVLRIHKGKQSRRQGFFGNTGIRLMRKCPCAVWLINPSRVKFQHVLGCVDTSTEDTLDAELNNRVFELAKSISHYHGGFFSIVHAWSVWNELFLQRRMDPDEFAKLVKRNHDQTEMHLEKFLKEHGSHAADDNVHLIEGEPADVIPRFARKNDVDLVVMGTVARSGVSGVVMGNTAEQMLNRMECSVLALKPSSFVSPIQPEG